MRRLQKVLSPLLIMAMLLTGVAATAVAADVPVVEQEESAGTVTASTVAASLPGGQFYKIWLGLRPENRSEGVTLRAEWNRDNPGSNGLGFFVLTANNLQAVVNGGALRDNNISAGSSIANLPGNVQGSTFSGDSTEYTVVLFNDSQTDAEVTLSVTNGLLSDDSGQVRDPNASADAAPVADAPAAEAAPVETPASAATPATTDTAVAESTAVAAEAAPAAAAPSTEPFVLRAEMVEGALPEQDSQHFLGLEPSQRDGEITLTLKFDPQDSSELARRLNFWVLDATGFQAYVNGTNPSEVAIAAGNRTFSGQTNERVATFVAAGDGPYTIIVYNNSQVPATYSLTAKGGVLIDDSQQTETAKEAAPAGSTGLAAAGESAAPAAEAVPAAGATPATDSAATTPARAGEPGGTYTVKAGDTLALIARDIYGDFSLYEQICAFNQIPDCARIEIGDVIKLPTQAQIDAGATAPAATPAPAAATPAPAATAVSTATTTSAATVTPTATTGTAVATPAATAAATPAGTPTASTDTNTLVDVAIDNGNFTILVKAVQAAGLVDDLSGAGPFTVFAPTDAAFNALGAATVDALLKDTAKLREVLLFHVVTGEIGSADLEDGLEAKTLQGSSITFTLGGATPKVQDSNIVVADVDADNGVIHVIDKVMLPPN